MLSKKHNSFANPTFNMEEDLSASSSMTTCLSDIVIKEDLTEEAEDKLLSYSAEYTLLLINRNFPFDHTNLHCVGIPCLCQFAQYKNNLHSKL